MKSNHKETIKVKETIDKALNLRSHINTKIRTHSKLQIFLPNNFLSYAM